MNEPKKKTIKERAIALYERSLQLKTNVEYKLENELQKKSPNLEIIENYINVIIHQSMQIEYFRLVSENKGFEAIKSTMPENYGKTKAQIKNSLYKKYNLIPNNIKF